VLSFYAWIISVVLIPVMGQHKDAYNRIYTNLDSYSVSSFIIDRAVHQSRGLHGMSSKSYLIGSIGARKGLIYDDDKVYSKEEYSEKYRRNARVAVLYNPNEKPWVSGHTMQVISHSDNPKLKYQRLVSKYRVWTYGPFFIITIMLFSMKFSYDKYKVY